jgi:hypothetical protein
MVTAGTAIGADFPGEPSWNGYLFGEWNTKADGSGDPFTASATVNGSITVYAQWSGAAGIKLSSPEDGGDGAFGDGDFILSKGGAESKTITINGGGYTNPRWYVDGSLKGTADSIIINAADYYKGKHSLSLIITKDGITWSKDITFTVTD